MTEPLSGWTLGLLLFCVLTDMGRELNFKAASLRVESSHHIASLAAQPLLWAGLVLWAIEGVAWLVVLEHVQLAIAFPVMALTYAVTPLAAGLVLRETLTARQRRGAALVALGVLVVSLSDLRA
ncbi:MAG: permease [Phenylobacterium sp.]|uniref:permease n=1 Tax=Phenylobacterium sp. TaxID=1871053 RepID=UPI0025F323F9|nr:permease [Phenylobacterium sp.]MBT9470831.1 permease [Phenylobacterium sp.]